MIAWTKLLDTLLASPAAARDADGMGVKREAAIQAPGAVPAAARTGNEVRLPSRAGLERQAPSLATQGLPQPLPRGAEAPAPHASAASAATDWSAAARLIRAALSQARGDGGPVRGTAPLWGAPANASPTQLARRLADAVVHSGLFYESHLAQLAQGRRTLQQLGAQPQAHASPARPDIGLVHQQLDLLATSHFRWIGLAWPGVPMEWSIRPDDDAPDERPRPRRRGRDAGAQGRGWSTTFALALPGLGGVEVRLTLLGDAVRARCVARVASSAGRLDARRDALARRFAAAGLRLESLAVRTAQAPG